MYVQIEKISADRNETTFFQGYMWDYEQETLRAYNRAKRLYSMPFAEADYLVDLYDNDDDLLDTFPMSDAGYQSGPAGAFAQEVTVSGVPLDVFELN